MSRAAQIVIVSLVISVVLLVGIPIVSSLDETHDASGGTDVVRDAALLEGAGTYVAFDDSAGYDETVFQTTGFAMNFTGADDSELSGSAVSFGNSSEFHVSVWARPDVGTSSETMQVTSVSDGELIIYYNGSSSEWAAYYYKQSTRDSFEVSIAAPSPAQSFTNLQVRSNSSHLAIFRNTTAGGAVDITVSNSVDAPTEASNWDGRVEELRSFDSAQNQTIISELYNQPTEQQPTLNRTSRLMFDQPSRDTTLILPSGDKATSSNVTFAAGFPEDVMQKKNLENDIAGTSDYRWETDGPQIEPLADNELDGAPVVYANYSRPATGISITSFMDWYAMAAVIPLILIGTYVITQVRV